MDKTPFGKSDLFVSPLGNDNWSGRLEEPNSDRSDGPLATLGGARDAVRRLKGFVFSKQAVKYPAGIRDAFTIWFRGGRYQIDKPVVFGPQDSAPVTYAAYPGEEPVFHGSRKIEGWSETEVNGTPAWVTVLPDVAHGKWDFRELFVGGTRAPRPRYPKNSLLPMESVPGLPETGSWMSGGGYTKFVAKEGDIPELTRQEEVEVVYVHFWIEERSKIASYNPKNRLVSMVRPSRAPLFAQGSRGGLADYYLDNVFEALKDPGEWYLDKKGGRLYYIPKEGETPDTTEVYAPTTLQLVSLKGNAENGEFVDFIRFEGLTFEQTDWRHPDPGDDAEFISLSGNHKDYESRRHFRGNDAAASQAAADVPGVIHMEAARYCSFDSCTVRDVGWYAFEIGDGSKGISIVHCTMQDVGAGGVKVIGASARDPLARRTGDHAITDNEITSCGRVFHSAVGVLAMNTYNTDISHNHIHDLFYSGISCGWVWGYQENVSRDNRIEKNHIHNLGQGLLSDMGGIYTLGVQPGTVIRGNHIYDVHKAHYGGWCIYPDEGSSHMLIENNVCYNTNDTIFNQHYGRENMVRNNIFAFGGAALISHGRAEPSHCSIRFERNILLTDGSPIFRGGYSCNLEDRNHTSDLNLLWDTSEKPFTFVNRAADAGLGLDEWKALGHDRHSIVKDPQFGGASDGDFTLASGSPAEEIGFVPIDLSDVGPRPRE